ncbi:ThiF family adenylyltransferase [Marinicella rhabdoformis]|uniref:ThiF family adenylyltransferase n=1 Tax=Marinicella rhabdoformis TaxID=2580566 RepID=UPI0012AEBF23|nr:ThiF family adenylyltransferase [Marinicella rhabdoformis]
MTWQCDVQQAWAWSQDASNVLIDVRSIEDRISTGMPKGAIFKHWSDLREDLDSLITAHQKILVICAVGQESLDFCHQLNNPALEGKLYSVEAGFDGWFMEDLPVTHCDATEERQRYDRQMRLKGFGQAGQDKLSASHVLIVGVGGLGVPSLQYLAAAGVGEITIIDDDVVSLSNLPRQVIFESDQIGKPKVTAAKSWVEKQNPGVKVNAINQRLSQLNAPLLLETVDLILDCSDNFQTRLTINQNCMKLSKPWIFAAITDFEFQLSFFDATDIQAPCFCCLFPEVDARQDRQCDTLGVLGTTPGVAGILQANESLKYLLSLTEPLKGKLLIQNLLTHQSKVIKYRARTDCPHHRN